MHHLVDIRSKPDHGPDRLIFVFVALFAMTTLTMTSVTAHHFALAVSLRYLMILVVFFGAVWLGVGVLRRGVLRKSTMAFLLGVALLYTYAILGATLNGGIRFFLENKMLAVFLVVSFLYCMTLFLVFQRMQEDTDFGTRGFTWLTRYFLLAPMIIPLTQGVTFGLPPLLHFQSPDGNPSFYSQGFTSFYAMGAVYFFTLSATAQRRKTALMAAALFCLLLSGLGGARGDLVAGLLTIGLITLRMPRVSSMLIIAGVVSLVFIVLIQSGLWQDILLFQRFARIAGGDYGMRDALFSQALTLLAQNPGCATIGCGFNYFQEYFGHPYGLYPHNILLEAAITFGLVAGIILVVLSTIGVAQLYFGPLGRHPIFYVFVVEFLTLMKSSTLIGFTSFPVLLVFAWAGGKAVLTLLSPTNTAGHKVS